jgi:hypothetical protein
VLGVRKALDLANLGQDQERTKGTDSWNCPKPLRIARLACASAYLGVGQLDLLLNAVEHGELASEAAPGNMGQFDFLQPFAPRPPKKIGERATLTTDGQQRMNTVLDDGLQADQPMRYRKSSRSSRTGGGAR